jgi:NitT/TauT family transport system substrate-binding protein
MKKISRRTMSQMLLAGTAVTLGGLKAPAVWGQANMPKIRAAYPPVLDAAIFHVGVAQGMYASERLDIELVPSPGGVATMSAVAANEFQVGIATVTALILGAVEDLNFQVVIPTSTLGAGPPEDLGALLMRKDSGMKNGAAVTGKRVGVLVLNNLPFVCTRLWIDKTGGDSSKVSFVEVPAPQMADALIGARVDLIASIDPFFTSALDGNPDKIDVAAYAYTETMPETMMGCAMMASDFTAKNKDTVQAFYRASSKAIDWMTENKGKPALAKIVSSYTRLPEDRVLSLRLWPKLEKTVKPTTIDRVSQAMLKYGLIKKQPAPNALIFESAMG